MIDVDASLTNNPFREFIITNLKNQLKIDKPTAPKNVSALALLNKYSHLSTQKCWQKETKTMDCKTVFLHGK